MTGERVALGPLRRDLAETYGRWINQPDVRFGVEYMQGGANLGISLGERRNQGLGSEATRLTLDWGFHVLGLHNVLLEALTWNEAAIRAYERAGFRRIGVRRKAAMSRGARADVILMDAIRADFGASVIAP